MGIFIYDILSQQISGVFLERILQNIIMNNRFFSLPEEKQWRILNAGFRVFANHSYKKDSSRLSENTEDPRKFNIPWVFSFCQNLRICV